MNAPQILLQLPNLKNVFWGSKWLLRTTDVIRKAQNESSGPLLALHRVSHTMPQRLNEM